MKTIVYSYKAKKILPAEIRHIDLNHIAECSDPECCRVEIYYQSLLEK